MTTTVSARNTSACLLAQHSRFTVVSAATASTSPGRFRVLSREEKVAGRAFRELATEQMNRLLAAWPAAETRPGFLRYVRHECPDHAGRTWAVEFREYYYRSPLSCVCSCGAVRLGSLLSVEEHGAHAATSVPEGRLALLFRLGICKCGFVVRSSEGRVVDSYEREVLRGAIEWKLELE